MRNNEKSVAYDLTNFTIRDMTACGKALRTLGNGAKSMEETARRIVHHLYENLTYGHRGNRACALVRFFKTHTYEKLDPELQGFSRDILGNSPASADMKCLTLLATVGENPEWNSRTTSKGHKVIPLPGEQAIRQIPMIQNLIAQLGLNASMVIKPHPEFLLDAEQKTYNVFYVPDAIDSPYIPAQREFVVPYGIKSVLGFGGVLPSGDIFAIITFLKVQITKEVADLFKTLALNVKIAVLPFENVVFTQNGKVTMGTTEIQYVMPQMAAFEQLLETYEKTALEQAESLYEEISEHKKAAEALKEREQFLQTLIDSIPVPIFFKDKGGKYISCNRAFEDFLGVQKGAIIGKTVYEVAPKELADHYHEADTTLFRNRGSQVYESRVKHSNGSVRDVIFHKAVFWDSKGGLAGLIGAILDITERKRMEESLRHRTDFEKTVASISRRFVIISDFDATISASLADIGRLCNAGRVYLFQFRDNCTILDSTHEWCDEGVTSGKQNLQNLPSATFSWWVAKLNANEIIHIADTSMLPAEAAAEKAIIEMLGIKSLLAIPIYAEKTLMGFIGFGDVKTIGLRSVNDIAMLQIVAEIMGNALRRKQAEELINNMAYHDALTQLPNRNLFQNHLQMAMAQTRRNQTVVAVMMLDLDDFKTINDSLGHQMGDSLLKVIAGRLTKCVREGDMVARMGGDEFMVILPELAQPQDAALIAQKILAILSEPFQIENHALQTTASIGISLFPLNADDPESLIKQADIAMYLSKKKGKNTYHFYKSDIVHV